MIITTLNGIYLYFMFTKNIEMYLLCSFLNVTNAFEFIPTRNKKRNNHLSTNGAYRAHSPLPANRNWLTCSTYSYSFVIRKHLHVLKTGVSKFLSH